MGEQMQEQQPRPVTFEPYATHDFINHETGVKIIKTKTGYRAVWTEQHGTDIGIQLARSTYQQAECDAIAYVVNVERVYLSRYHAEALKIEAKRNAKVGWTKVGRKHWRHTETGVEIVKRGGAWDIDPIALPVRGLNPARTRCWSSKAAARRAAVITEVPAARQLIALDEELAYAEAQARSAGRIFDVPPGLLMPTPADLGARISRIISDTASDLKIGTATYGVYEREQRTEAVIAPQLHSVDSAPQPDAGKLLCIMRDLLLVMPDANPSDVAARVAEEHGITLPDGVEL